MAPAIPVHYNWQVRAIAIPGPDTDLALYVAFDNARYLFGCGEGTQRAFVQKRVGSRWLGGIFICDGGLKGRGGLPGRFDGAGNPDWLAKS
jgi:ribonuclease Z